MRRDVSRYSLGVNAGVHANNVCPSCSKARGILLEQGVEKCATGSMRSICLGGARCKCSCAIPDMDDRSISMGKTKRDPEGKLIRRPRLLPSTKLLHQCFCP
jgi:hypothetical protein